MLPGELLPQRIVCVCVWSGEFCLQLQLMLLGYLSVGTSSRSLMGSFFFALGAPLSSSSSRGRLARPEQCTVHCVSVTTLAFGGCGSYLWLLLFLLLQVAPRLAPVRQWPWQQSWRQWPWRAQELQQSGLPSLT